MRRRRGFTLTELVLVILVAGIAIPAVVFTFYEVARKGLYDEARQVAVLLAQGELERLLQKDFLQLENGEPIDNPVSFGGNFQGYGWQLTIDYVDTADLNTAVAGPTDYKRVSVKVVNNSVKFGAFAPQRVVDVVLATIVTKHY